MSRILVFLCLLVISACTTPEPTVVGEVEGLKPIYITEEENVVEVKEARPFEDLGKIVYAAPYLLINERFKGIHVINNSNPADPIKIGFIQIPGNTEFTLKNNFIYANHGNDLKAFQISDFASSSTTEIIELNETAEIKLVFGNVGDNAVTALFPPQYDGFFECVEDNGIVVGWEETILVNPKCRT